MGVNMQVRALFRCWSAGRGVSAVWAGQGWQAATRVAPSARRGRSGTVGGMWSSRVDDHRFGPLAGRCRDRLRGTAVQVLWWCAQAVGLCPDPVGARPRGLRPPRVRCRDCKVTHVVLPARVPARCSATAEVVGQVLLTAACGQGHRGIAARIGLPADTVRGWLRRARAHAEKLRAVGTRAAVRYDVNFISIVPRHEALADAVEALGRAAMAVRIRLGVDAVPPQVGPWELIVWLCRDDLLGPRARSG